MGIEQCKDVESGEAIKNNGLLQDLQQPFIQHEPDDHKRVANNGSIAMVLLSTFVAVVVPSLLEPV